jgi:hypothetical protein
MAWHAHDNQCSPARALAATLEAMRGVAHDKRTGSGLLDSDDEAALLLTEPPASLPRQMGRMLPTLPQPWRGYRLYWRTAVHANVKQPARRSASPFDVAQGAPSLSRGAPWKNGPSAADLTLRRRLGRLERRSSIGWATSPRDSLRRKRRRRRSEPLWDRFSDCAVTALRVAPIRRLHFGGCLSPPERRCDVAARLSCSRNPRLAIVSSLTPCSGRAYVRARGRIARRPATR